jgi:uncharacterized protein (DUF427 family)
MATARWNGTVIAKSDDTIEVEGNQYFPPGDVKMEFLVKNDSKHTTCPWKGQASYYDIKVNNKMNEAVAWVYPDPNPAAKKITGFIAFWKGVEVEE